MKSDFSNDPHFTEIPQWIQEGLKHIPVTGIMGEDDWHETGFHHMDGTILQCGILNRRWVALSQSEVNSFDSLIYVIVGKDERDENGKLKKYMINLAKPAFS